MRTEIVIANMIIFVAISKSTTNKNMPQFNCIFK